VERASEGQGRRTAREAKQTSRWSRRLNSNVKLKLSILTTLPPKYHPLIAENQPRIQDIVVMEIKPSPFQTETDLN
jgi:hypothetical protein